MSFVLFLRARKVLNCIKNEFLRVCDQLEVPNKVNVVKLQNRKRFLFFYRDFGVLFCLDLRAEINGDLVLLAEETIPRLEVVHLMEVNLVNRNLTTGFLEWLFVDRTLWTL